MIKNDTRLLASVLALAPICLLATTGDALANPFATGGWAATSSSSRTINGLSVTYSETGNDGTAVISDFSFSTGKHYFEFTVLNGGGAGSNDGDPTSAGLGVATASLDLTNIWAANNAYFASIDAWDHARAFQSLEDGSFYSAASGGTPFDFTPGDLIGMAVDADAGKVWFSKNGHWGSETGPLVFSETLTPTMQATWLSNQALYVLAMDGKLGNGSTTNSGGITANFGGSAFTHPVPVGFNQPLPPETPTPAALGLLAAGLLGLRWRCRGR